MRRRRLLLGVGVLALLGLAGLLLTLYTTRPPPGVSPDNFWRLRTGMTEQEVEAVLAAAGLPEDEGPTWCMKRWRGSHCDILVFFGKREGFPVVDGSLVTEKGAVVRLDEREEGFLDRLRRLLP